MRDDHFERRPLTPEPFANSLGAFTGEQERLEVRFNDRTAPFAMERE